MKCPKCESELETIKFQEIEIERCVNCRGLWFDMLEKEDLLKIEGSEEIDIGDAQVGEEYSKQRDIDCPVCAEPMIPMVDKDQSHIRFESCPICYGAFFDAGEFRDLKEHSVIERFVRMLKTLRANL